MERHAVVHELAVRLMLGEVIDLTDEHGRRWQAKANALSWLVDGETARVIVGDTFEVAARLAGLRTADP